MNVLKPPGSTESWQLTVTRAPAPKLRKVIAYQNPAGALPADDGDESQLAVEDVVFEDDRLVGHCGELRSASAVVAAG